MNQPDPTDADLLAALACTQHVIAFGDDDYSVDYWVIRTLAGRYRAKTVREALIEVWRCEHTPEDQ